MMREIDVDELLDMIKNEKIEEYFQEIVDEDEEIYDELKLIRWIKNNIHIKLDQKEKLKEAIFLEDEYEPEIVTIFASALLDKDEIKTLINGKNNLDSYVYTYFIIVTGEIEKYLTTENIKEWGLKSEHIYDLIKETGEIEKYLTTENIKEWGLDSNQISKLIGETGNIEKYLTAENIKEWGLDSYNVYDLICDIENKENYLMTVNIEELGLNPYCIYGLIEQTGNIEKYLTTDKIDKLGLDSNLIFKLIKETGEIEKYLTTDNIKEWGLKPKQIYDLIKETGHIDYLTKEKIQEFGMSGFDLIILIRETEHTEYLTIENIEKWGLDSYDIEDLIKETRHIGDYLTAEKVKEFGLNLYQIGHLIDESGYIYCLTAENIKEWGLELTQVRSLINQHLNDSNLYLIYDLGWNRDIIDNSDLIYRNLDYILEKEDQLDKKDILLRMYDKNEDILKVNFEILDNKYLQALGEDKINQISCYLEYMDCIINLNETELKLLGRCLDFYEKNNKTEEWTPFCKKILENIEEYSKLFEIIENIDGLPDEDINGKIK